MRSIVYDWLAYQAFSLKRNFSMCTLVSWGTFQYAHLFCEVPFNVHTYFMGYFLRWTLVWFGTFKCAHLICGVLFTYTKWPLWYHKIDICKILKIKKPCQKVRLTFNSMFSGWKALHIYVEVMFKNQKKINLSADKSGDNDILRVYDI